MKYSEQKAKEIREALLTNHVNRKEVSDDLATLELKIKEIIRDVRHKCAENVNKLKGNYRLVDDCHNEVMNTDMDK